jgi:hypothetical protein
MLSLLEATIMFHDNIDDPHDENIFYGNLSVVINN